MSSRGKVGKRRGGGMVCGKCRKPAPSMTLATNRSGESVLLRRPNAVVTRSDITRSDRRRNHGTNRRRLPAALSLFGAGSYNSLPRPLGLS